MTRHRVKSLAIVTAFYPPSIGGIERYVQEFARAASALGLSVNIVTTAQTAKPEVTIEESGIKVLRIPAWYVPLSGSYFPVPLGGRRLMGEFLNCDVVMAHTRFFLTTIMAAQIVARRGGQIYVMDHGAGPLRPAPFFRAAATAYEHLITGALRFFSPRFLAVSPGSADWLRRFGIYDVEIVANGVGPTVARPVRDERSFERPVVFYAGRLLDEKGIVDLVDAVEILKQNGRNIQLRIAGRGPLSEMLKARAKESGHLTYLGGLAPDKIAEELQNATVLVNPSKLREGFSRIVLEAGSAALPVLSTPNGACGNLIQEGVTGWLIPPGSAGAIAARLEEAFEMREESLRRGVALFDRIQQSYTWPSIVRAFLGNTEMQSTRDRGRSWREVNKTC
ncbi:MAG TPA: glycosyltransferase family 4 protein [Xanthobacteraceae bacterium]